MYACEKKTKRVKLVIDHLETQHHHQQIITTSTTTTTTTDYNLPISTRRTRHTHPCIFIYHQSSRSSPSSSSSSSLYIERHIFSSSRHYCAKSHRKVRLRKKRNSGFIDALKSVGCPCKIIIENIFRERISIIHF